MAVLPEITSANFAFSSGVTRYIWPGSSDLWGVTNEARRSVRERIAGSYLGVALYVAANDTTGSSTVKSRKNVADGNITFTIGAGATGTFEDAAHTDTIAAGDDYSVQLTSGAGGTAVTLAWLRAMFAGDTTTVQHFGSSNDGSVSYSSASTTTYTGMGGRTMPSGTTEVAARVLSAPAGTLGQLFAYITSNGRSTTTTVRIRIAGADSTSVISIAGAATGLFEDTTHEDAVADGDAVNFSIVTGTGTGAVIFINIAATHRTTTGRGMLTRIGTLALAGAVTQHLLPGSGDVSFTSDIRVPVGIESEIGTLYVRCQTNNCNSASTVTVRKGGVDTAVTVSIGSSATGDFSDTTHTATFAAADEFNWRLVAGGTGAQSISLRGVSVRFARVITAALVEASSTNAARAFTPAKAVVLVEASSTNAARPFSIGKLLVLVEAVEVDGARLLTPAKSALLVEALEVDGAGALVVGKALVLVEAVEVDGAATFVVTKALVLVEAAEIDGARLLTPAKSALLVEALEVDAAGAFVVGKLLVLVEASSTNAARPFSIGKLLVLVEAVEVDGARLLTPAKSALLVEALEVDGAGALVVAKLLVLGETVEAELAATITPAKALALALALEVDTAGVISYVRSVIAGQAVEVELAGPFTPAKAAAFVEALEVDAGRALTLAKLVALLGAGDVDTARALLPAKLVEVAGAAEADTAALLTPLKALTLAQALEDDLSASFTTGKLSAVARALELEAGRLAVATKAVALGSPVEVDVARPFVISKLVVVRRALEHDLAFPFLVRHRGITVEVLVELHQARAASVYALRAALLDVQARRAATVASRRSAGPLVYDRARPSLLRR